MTLLVPCCNVRHYKHLSATLTTQSGARRVLQPRLYQNAPAQPLHVSSSPSALLR